MGLLQTFAQAFNWLTQLQINMGAEVWNTSAKVLNTPSKAWNRVVQQFGKECLILASGQLILAHMSGNIKLTAVRPSSKLPQHQDS